MREHLRTYAVTYAVLTGFILLSGVFLTISPTELLDIIGSDNAYIIMFVLAFVGGITTFSGIPYHIILMGFASAGINPIFLGVVTAGGVMMGDSVSYLMGRGGGAIIPSKFQKVFHSISSYLEQRPGMVFPGLFLYGSLSPLSNDFIVISLGLARFSYWRMIVPLALGNVVYNTALAYIGLYGYEWLIG